MRAFLLACSIFFSSSLWATHYFELVVYKQDTVYQSHWKGVKITDEFNGLMLTPVLSDTLLGSLDTAHAEIVLTETFLVNGILPPLFSLDKKNDTVLVFFETPFHQPELLINTSAASLISLENLSVVSFHGLYPDSVVTHTSSSIPIPRFRLIHPDYEKPKVVTVVQEKPVNSFFEQVQTWLFALVLLTAILTFVLIFKRIKS